MVSSSEKKVKGCGGSSSGKGGSSGGARMPRGSGDNSRGSDSVLGSPEPHGDILGRPTVDPWYRSSERFPFVPVSLQPPSADWEIQRNEMLAVPLVFDFQCSRAIEWADWIDSELADRGFCDRLEQAGVLRSILISRCSNMYRDTEALRQLRTSGCCQYWVIKTQQKSRFPPEESKIEAVLADYIGRKNVALGTQAARFNSWMEHFLRMEDPLIRRAAFVAYWLSKCVFGQLYTQLDLLHAEELAGASCHIVTAAFNSSIVHTFIWEHALEEDVPAVFRWVGSKFYDHNLIPSLDSESKDYTLITGNVGSLTYLSATNAGWLPVLSSDGPQFTIYSAHRVRRQFGFDQEIPAIMGSRMAIGIGAYTAGMANYWRGLMAAMVEFRNSGRGDISHLLESYTSPLPHPRLFGATNTMTTYANRQSLGYAVWYHEDSRWVIYGNHHPPLWLRDHPYIAAPGKVPSSRGKRNVSAGTPTAVKRKQPDRSKKGEAVSKDSLTQASKKQKTSVTKGSKEVLTLKTVIADPPPAEEDIPEGVSAPVSRKPVRKTRAGKRTFVPPTFPSAPLSIAARVAARKSSRGVVYSEKRSKQRADTAARIPIEIPDDLSSSSSSSDKDDPSGAAAKEIESEDTETATAKETENEDTEGAAAETVSGADDFTADISLADIGSLDTDAIINASSEEKDVEAGASTEDDEVSMDELGAVGATSDSDSTASASKPKSAEGAIEEHVTVGVVTGAERVVETTPIAVTSSGGTVQGDLSGSGSHVDPSLLDSSPSTRQYVRRALRGSLVSTDSDRTASVTIRVPTPPSPLRESGGTTPTPIIIAAAVSAAATVQEGETAPTVIEEVPVHEEVLAHIPEVPEDMTHVEPAEVAASEEPVQADVTPDSGVPIIEEELAQGPVDDVDMADTHDSYDEVWADAEDNMAGVQAADMEVTAPVAAQTSPTKTAGSDNETVAEEERRLQTVAVESAIRGQPGLLSAARPATLGSSVLAEMDAFFREFDRTSFSSRYAEHFWVFDNVKDDFEIFRVPQVGIRFLKAFRRILAELRVAEARVAALREALNTVAPNPWDLASASRVSAEARAESALQGLLS
uniref:Aminotransferase-like plant mobile domain-containing protein n=1 Tax=Fagus sylvatica TaxID=28930 RepID=A0A2N9J9H8_FAGSY